MNKPSWSERLRQARRLDKLTEQELADKVGVARQTISNIERGRSEGFNLDLVDFVLAQEASICPTCSGSGRVVATNRINDLEQRFNMHTHPCFTNEDSHDPLIGNTGLPIMDTSLPET